MKGFIIAGSRSGIGKTTISIGIMRGISKKELGVSPFKIGPDYIDGKFHEYATKNKSYNLDYFLMGEEGIKYSFFSHHKNISIVEGVMGLYDGRDNSFDNGSTAHISRILNLPIILIVEGKGRSTTIAGEIIGYKMLDPRINIAGVIINKVSSVKTYNILKEAIEKFAKVDCLGYVPEINETSLSSRHLGLVEAPEVENLDEKLDILSEKISETVDMEKIEEILNKNNCDIKKEMKFYNKINIEKYKNIKIGIAKDEAFSFYYNDNIEFLEKLGIKIKYFSPINDEKIPEDVDMLYFGGGYPENYGAELSNNKKMIESIRNFYNRNGIIYGECGGFIYLSNSLKTLENKIYEFVGLSGCSIKMRDKLNIKRFGYVDLEYKNESENKLLIGRGHEFHYSEIISEGENIFKEDVKKSYEVKKSDGRSWECGYSYKNLLCGYPHLHFFTSEDIIFNLLDKNVFNKGELEKDSVVKEYLTTAIDGKNYKIKEIK